VLVWVIMSRPIANARISVAAGDVPWQAQVPVAVDVA